MIPPSPYVTDLTMCDCVTVCCEQLLCRDAEELSAIAFNHCVLDEGHLIKNPKSATAKAVKRLHAKHRQGLLPVQLCCCVTVLVSLCR